MMHKHTLLLASSLLLIYGCGNDDADYDFDTSREGYETAYLEAQAPAVIFDSATGEIPFPNDVLLGPDGTLNVPIEDGAPTSDPRFALNALDGFSTTAAFSAPMSRLLTASSVVAGSTVRVFQGDTNPETFPAVTGIVRELGPEEFLAIPLEGQLVIQPTRPLSGNSTYVVVLTTGITAAVDDAEMPLRSPIAFDLANSSQDLNDETLKVYQGMVRAMMAALQGHDSQLTKDTVAMAWSFTTQSISDTLSALAQTGNSSNIVVLPTGFNTSQLVADLPGVADLYAGTIDLPYYGGIPSTENPLAAINAHWMDANGGELTRYSPMPAATGTMTVPVLMSLPNASSGNQPPAEGWPITIFQHGITTDRTNLIAIADALAAVGIAGIAIDMPLHGITNTESPLYAGNTGVPNLMERTFDMDLVNNDTGAPGPDGNIDGSGLQFINLQSLLTSRDNLRQAQADLMVLSNSVGNIFDAGTNQPVAINTGAKSFVGHSLGGIVGTTFLSFDSSITAASLGMPGASIPYLLTGSDAFAPVINGGLEAAGIETGSAEWEQFLLAAQTVVDSGDPVNYAIPLAITGKPVHMIEVIGDTVVPNSVPGRAFAGTEPLAALMGLPSVTGSTSGSGLVRFTAGLHSSLLSPFGNLDPQTLTEAQITTLEDVNLEMQQQVASFLSSAGNTLSVGTDYIQTGE